jgi:hypothetical protein
MGVVAGLQVDIPTEDGRSPVHAQLSSDRIKLLVSMRTTFGGVWQQLDHAQAVEFAETVQAVVAEIQEHSARNLEPA